MEYTLVRHLYQSLLRFESLSVCFFDHVIVCTTENQEYDGRLLTVCASGSADEADACVSRGLTVPLLQCGAAG